MGVRFLVLLIALVPLASSRDLRTASTVNRRTAPDPLLVQLFNDPTATSQLTKKLLDGSDDGSASGSGLWAASGDGPKASDDTTAKTVTKPNPVKLANDDATVWANSGSGSGALPATKTEDETVETKDDSVANVDVNAKKSSFIPSETQTVTDQVEEGNNVRDSTAAPKGDANDMYDATVVKKNEVPKPDDATATGKSVVVHTPEGGLLPLTSDQNAQQQSQDLSQMTAQPQQDMAQVAAQPVQDMSQAAAQPLQDMSQAAVQPQQVSPQPDMSQYAMQPQQDMPQDAQQQDAAPPQMMAPNMANSTLYQGAPLQSNDQGYGQYQDPSQAGAYTQDSNQDPSMDQPSVQGQAAVNPYASQDYFGNQLDPQTGLPIAGMQQVPVFKGLKAKKIDIKEDECEDMYDACPDMAKNEYCTKFSDLMHVQCKKSCGFCQVKDEASGDSGSGSAMWNDLPQEGDKVVAGESGSGSAIAADAWSNSASGENMIKGEADAVADDEPAPAEKNESAVADTLESSGSGQQSTSEEFGSGANLAEDLATGTVSKAEQDTSETKETNESEETTEPKSKYSEIPGAPQVIIQQQPAAEVYPHIDLKTIAKAVDAYKSTALRMLGEAIRDSAQEAENKAAKRTSIPMPPANDLLKKMGFPMDQPRSQMRELEYPFAPYWQTMAAQQEAAAARAKIAKAKEDARKKAKAEAEAKAKKLKEDQEASGDLDDPYMYVRHMPKGASMQPIESHPGASNTPHGHSNPIILFKNSQISNAVAAKKNAIPKPSVSKFLMQQMPQAAPAARSGVEQPMFNPMETAPSNDFIQDSNLEMPANSTQGYVQQTPLGDNQMMNSFNADSQAALVQPQPQAGGLNMAASFFNQQPMPSPHADVNILPESNSYFANQPNQEMATAQVGGKEQTKSSISDEAISGHSPEVSDEHSDDSLYHSLADELSSSDVKKTLESNGKGTMAEISGKIPKKSNVFAAINDIDDISKEDVGSPPDDLSNSEPAQQRGVLPPLNYGKNLPPLNHGMESASNLPPLNHGMGSSLPPLNYGTEAAKNLPPLNHGAELPPLNHGKEFAANLPPLNHEMKAEALPPLNHGMESASNLPPLLKGVEQEKIIQPFAKTGKGFDPGFYGNEEAANIPVQNSGKYNQPMGTDYFKSKISQPNNIVSYNLKSEISRILGRGRNNDTNVGQVQENNAQYQGNPSSNFYPNVDPSGFKKSNIDIVNSSSSNDSAQLDKYGNFVSLASKPKKLDDSDDFADVDESKIFKNANNNFSSFSQTPLSNASTDSQGVPFMPRPQDSQVENSDRKSSFPWNRPFGSAQTLPQDSKVENSDKKSSFPWNRPFGSAQTLPQDSQIENSDKKSSFPWNRPFGSAQTLSQTSFPHYVMVDENPTKKDTTWFTNPKLTQENAAVKSTLGQPMENSLANSRSDGLLSTKVKMDSLNGKDSYLAAYYKGRDSLRRLSYDDNVKGTKGVMEEALNSNADHALARKKGDLEPAPIDMPIKVSSFSEGGLFNQLERQGMNSSASTPQLASFNGNDVTEMKSKKPDVLPSMNGNNATSASFIEGALFNQMDISPLNLKAKQQDLTGNNKQQQDTPPKTVSFNDEGNHVMDKSQKSLQTNVLGKEQVNSRGALRDSILGYPNSFETQENPSMQSWQQIHGSTTLSQSPLNSFQPGSTPMQNAGNQFLENTPQQPADNSQFNIAGLNPTASQSFYNPINSYSVGPANYVQPSTKSEIRFNSPSSTFRNDAALKQVPKESYFDYTKTGKGTILTNQRTNSNYVYPKDETLHGFRSSINFPEASVTPGKTGDSVKSYHPPIALPPLEHAQSSPEMNLFYSNPADTEGSRYMITSDQTNNGLQSSPGTTNFMQSLNQNQLPPLKYASVQAAAPPIYPYSIPPEGAAQSQSYAGNGNGGVPQIGPILFPEGGHPYPEPLPPEGNQQDQLSTKGSAIGKKNLIRPKPDLKCGSGWTGAYGDFGTFCYQLSFDKSTWNDARKSCVSAGGDLFSVTNAYEQRFLENFTNSEAWIGYRDKSLAGTWTWSDGSKSVYSDWDSSAKDDHGKGRDCVVLDSDEGKWRDDSCSQKYSFLCKKSADDCNEGWKKLTLNSVRGCYKFNEDKKTWDEAQQACLNDEGALASILSDDEQTMVSQVYSKHDMWIGYNDKDNEGDWVWPDRMTSSYTNWDDKSPNNGGVTCAIITRTGRWHDEPCQSKYSYLCKKPSPKTLKDLQNDGILTQKVNDFIADNNLVPNIDTSVSIFGRQAVSPRYFWTAQKIYNNKIHGSSPISIHGHIKSVDGGLQLNGVDSWLDAGDFYGQCLGDPDLCIKGFSFAMQLNFDDDAKSYKDKRYIMDSAGDSRGISIYLENSTVHYKVVTSSKTWDLSTDLVTNDWQDVVLTWKKEEGLMLYVNGAFRDSQKDGTATNPVPNKQARLTVGRKSGNPPYRYTRMYISSLYAFTRFLSPEDIPYVFTYDDTVTARYTWLLPELRDGKVEGSPEIEVNGPVKAVDGGVFIDGTKSYLKVGDFQGRCISDPTKCPHGLSLSYKLKLNRKVRTYKERRYIMDSGGHVSGNKGIAAYINNNNLYFTLAMSTPDDTLRWTVRTSIFTVRWQRVVLTWSVKKGLWLYIDGQFRGLTSTPKTIPRDEVEQNSEFIIGRRNIGDDYKPAEFSIGSLSIFKRFLDKKDVSKVFGEKKMPYPGLIREVWKELPGKDLSKLKEDPYYPNDPSLVEIIENFDAPFDVEKDFGSRVKGYFVAPETGNYTFYLSGSKSTELWLSKGESQQNMSSMIALHDSTGHNQWNKFTAQISKSVRLEAGKYYYIIALEKGTESTDSLSAGVRLPSGRFMRPVSKEMLQWRLPGDPFAGVIREVWQDVAGYKITDLTSNKNFPNNPSSIEVLDKFDAPHNIDDNYGARVRGYFKAPEDGKYRFYLAADTTGELWLSTDESENNVRKIITLNGWTAHNQWLKFPEQKSEHIKLKKGRYYYFEVYHKADKLADCASVAVEFPSGHFEGPIKRVHLSWRLPDGITGPGPSSEEEAVPKPAGLYPLNDQYTANDASGNNDNGVLRNVKLVDGPDGKPNGAYEFSGSKDSYIEIPKSNVLDTKNSITLLANVYPTGNGGPIINYKTDGWGVHLWQFESNELFVRFVHRNGVFHKPIGSRVIQKNTWNQVGATYDNTTGVARLWHNGKMVKSRNIGRIRLMTQYPVRIGARDGDERRFTGKISCVQIYRKALDQQQIGNLKQCPVKAPADEESSGSGSGLSALLDSASADHTGVSISHQAGKYDKDEEADDLIQGSEFVTGAKKCDPNPCENYGKCIKDAKRLDGYRCKCSSDFTGRNCQVSKPDAENPVVKRTKIPKAEKKEGSEKYQKNTTSNGVIEQMREEKKEDVLLLFQKLGCYKDEMTRHDIPNKVSLKAVSQEDCVRACALKEQGYSYFGLQNSDQCYCGHKYGRYGKSDDALCNKRCNGNSDENCGGNSTNMVYFFGLGTNYTVNVYTGDKEDSDSDAKVYITLYGDKGDSGFRKLGTNAFTKKQTVSETMLLPELGDLKKVRILHDNSGKHPSWFLNKVTVTDENGKVYNFPCHEWLSETRGGGKTERLLFADNTNQS